MATLKPLAYAPLRCLSFVFTVLTLGGALTGPVDAQSNPVDQAPRGVADQPLRFLDESKKSDDGKLILSARRADLARIGARWQMDEPVWLDSLTDTDEAYRVWYEPPFGDLTVVRAWHTGAVWKLAVRILAERDRFPYRLGKCVFSVTSADPARCAYPSLKVNTERAMREDEAAQMRLLLNRLNFWKLPREEASRPVMDGVTWRLEGMHGVGQSHDVTRRNPPQGAFVEFADYLLTLARSPP